MPKTNRSTVQPFNPSTDPARGSGERPRRDLALLVFLTLLGSYAYFWQSRDWNAASRLMLTYSLVDRGTVSIDGLEEQAAHREDNPLSPRYGKITDGDIAQVGPHFYSDKAPGQSLLGVPIYALERLVAGVPSHPVDRPAYAYWPGDYLVTLSTAGVLTAALGVVIYAFALRLGCPQVAAVVLSLAYGLGTPAFVYATLFYGHQTSAFCSLMSFFILHRAVHDRPATAWPMFLSGLLAGYAVVTEYQTIGISVALAAYAVFGVRQVRPLAWFFAASATTVCLLGLYNYRAFGSPFDLGYAHEVSAEFRAVHSSANPLGLRLPDWAHAREVLGKILWGRYRGLVFYAPVLIAAPAGLVLLLVRKHWGTACVLFAAVAWMLLVTVSYPKWEGGWCTGPRLIVASIPFAVLAVAGLFGAILRRGLTWLAGVAALAGAVLMLACVAVGGRFPPYRLDAATQKLVPLDPLTEVVWPHWRGDAGSLSGDIAGGRQFDRNAGRWLLERFGPAALVPPEPSPWQALQMAPLVAYWLAMVGVLVWRLSRRVAK